jgi:hypothetical protein
MFPNRLTNRTLAALIVMLLVGGAVWILTAVVPGSSPQLAKANTAGASDQQFAPCTSAPAPAGAYRRNQSGQTYGSSAGVCPAQEPDLIRAVGASSDGGGPVEGYVLKSQLDAATGENVNSPQAAVAWTQGNAGKNTTIPLYAADGTTVIGSFTVSADQPSPSPSP